MPTFSSYQNAAYASREQLLDRPDLPPQIQIGKFILYTVYPTHQTNHVVHCLFFFNQDHQLALKYTVYYIFRGYTPIYAMKTIQWTRIIAKETERICFYCK
jgi:hypothetical protein